MLNIVGTNAEKLLLERAYIPKSKIYSLDSDLDHGRELSIGKLDNLKDAPELINQIKLNSQIRIWYSSINSEDLNRYLYLISLISRINPNSTIYKIDITVYNPQIYGLIACTEENIKELINYQQKLTKTDIEIASYRWKELLKENADLRVKKDEILVSIPKEELEKRILEELSHLKERPVNYFIGDLLAKNVYNIQSYRTYEDLIASLIKKHKIQIVRTEKQKGIFEEELSINIISIKK